MKPIKCVKCGQLAAFPTAVKEPYTCLTCQEPEQPAPSESVTVKAVGSSELLSGVELIKAERQRQISAEGWTPKHDDTHKHGQMAFAGAAYARLSGQIAIHGATNVAMSTEPLAWPWAEKWWKPSEDQVRNLVKAGALIAAEIDRIQRLKAKAR